MMKDELPPSILARHPELVQVGEALRAYREGRTVETRCGLCGKPLEVIDVVATNELWVTCPTGDTNFRVRRGSSM